MEALDIIGMLQHGELSTGVIVDRKIMATAAMALNFLCGSVHIMTSPFASASGLVVSFKINFDLYWCDTIIAINPN